MMTREQLDQATDDVLNAEAAKVMGWEWRRWKPSQLPQSIAEFEQVRNVVFLMHPTNNCWGSTEPADPASGVLNTSEEHKRMRLRWPGPSSVTWHAMLPPSPSTSIADAWELVLRLRSVQMRVNIIVDGDRTICDITAPSGRDSRSACHASDTRAITTAALLAWWAKENRQ